MLMAMQQTRMADPDYLKSGSASFRSFACEGLNNTVRRPAECTKRPEMETTVPS
jgi:hypothetical protein